MILLCSAVEAELAFWSPRPGVDRIVTGVGPVEAACTLAAALVQSPYRLVVNAGLAGAFDAAAEIGDGVVVAEDAIELGLETGAPIALPSGAKLVNEARSTADLVEQLRAKGFPVLRGVTVSRVTSSEATAGRLASELGAQVETMEGFAALRAAELAGVSAIEVRGISNRCGDRERSGWNFDAGISGLQRIVEALFECIR